MRNLFPFLLSLALVHMPGVAAPLQVSDVTEPAAIVHMALSPDGKNLAAIAYNGFNHGLVIIDTATLKHRLIFSGRRVVEGGWRFHKSPNDVEWAGNDLLAVDFGAVAESLDLEGRMVQSLGETVIGPAERAKKDSPMKLVFTDVEDGDIAIVNARTGEKKRFKAPSGKPIKWAFDKDGELRAVTMVNSAFWKDDSTVSNWYRSSRQAEWTKLADFKITDDYWVPLYVPDEPGKLVVYSRHGRDTYALFDYDTQQRSMGAMMAGHETVDILSAQGIEKEAFSRVVTNGMIPQYIWFDPAWLKLQVSIDAEIPGRVNVLSGDPNGMVLVYSYGDVDPGTWYLLDASKMTLREIGQSHPKIKPAEMRPKERITYAAGDGLAIPAYLTRPAGVQGPQPMVVMIHGGPVARDHWHWDPDVQLLASHGYVVFQPQFRGSSGFGRKFEEAGFGQWGRTMQDDVTAGVEYLIKQGIADPQRICIYGGSYGGYAAMWGLAKTPDLYRCGISFAGVSDIEYMFSDWSDRMWSKVSREMMRHRIGNAKEDSARFAEVSPLQQAARIKAPVLLMHGSFDRRVPISHAEKMKRALERNKKAVEMEVFDEAGHGLHFVKHQNRYYERMLEFLARHLKAGPT